MTKYSDAFTTTGFELAHSIVGGLVKLLIG